MKASKKAEQIRKPEKQKKQATVKIYGPFFRFARFLASPFLRRCRLDGPAPEAPTVFLCRHKNMQGPLATLTSYGMEAHPLVLSVFFHYNDCRRQYRDFTFSERAGMKKPVAAVLSSLAALVVVPTIRSLRSIPVYRGRDLRSASTVKMTVECLVKGENVILYPDLAYSDVSDRTRDIYSGFLLFDKYYFRETGQHIRFVVLTPDKENRLIRQSAPLSLPEGPATKEAEKELLTDVRRLMFPNTSDE